LIAKRIAEAIQYPKQVLEVGPGKGIMTRELLPVAESLKASEIDKEAIQFLTDLDILKKGQIIEGDFLQIDISSVFDGEFSIIGNFPYYISSQIVFKVIDNHSLIPEMVGMFQKEVAERIFAPPGSKTYGGISVLVASRYQSELLFILNEEDFNPPPKVKSAVIRLERKADALDDDAYRKLSVIVKAAFNQRRKTLRNSLRSVSISEIPSDLISKRPEQCSLEDFLRLSALLQ